MTGRPTSGIRGLVASHSACSAIILFMLTARTTFAQPSVTLVSPPDGGTLAPGTVTFECDAFDSTGLRRVTLFSDFSGSWGPVSTVNFPGGGNPVPSSVQAWLHLDEPTGPTTQDASGYGRDGLINGAVYVPDGRLNGAYAFDGGSAVITMPSSDYGLPGQTGATIAAWVRPASGAQASASGTIVFFDRAGATATRMLLSVNSNRTVSVKARSNAEGLLTATTVATLPIGVWSHVVGVIDLTTQQGLVYINGQLSIASSLAFAQGTFANTTATNACLGAISGSSGFSFLGDIDETLMFNRVLSPAEVGQLYEGVGYTAWRASFDVLITQVGSHLWNCEAENLDLNTAMAGDHFTLSIQPGWVFDYVNPTPPNGGELGAREVTIKVASNRELQDATLLWLGGGGVQEKVFEVSIDAALRQRWGFEYPATYVFDIVGGQPEPTILRRANLTDPWSVVPVRLSTEFFNGVEAVRFEGGRAYVSVGFGATNSIYLKFEGADVSYNSVALYYDNRRATYTLSNDNWGKISSANAGVPCSSMTQSSCDKYQASVMAARSYHLPVSVAVNSAMVGGQSMWDLMQQELDVGDRAWEPAVHGRHHVCGASDYVPETLGCRDDILANLTGIPYGQYVFEFILPCGYQDNGLQAAAAGEFLFVRDWTGGDHPWSTVYEPWNTTYNYYGIGGFETKAYDAVLQARSPAGRYYASDVANLNAAFDTVYNAGGIFYAMWHPDRYDNSVVHDRTSPPVDGVSGSTLMQHWEHVANRLDVWYVTNGWMYSYKMVLDRVQVNDCVAVPLIFPMTIMNAGLNTSATHTVPGLVTGTIYAYKVTATEMGGGYGEQPPGCEYRTFTATQPFICVSGGDCDDGDPCTDDVCTEGVCSNPHNTAPCDDGYFCTAVDRCSGGACAGSGTPCAPPLTCDETGNACVECLAAADCDNLDPCDGVETCIAGVCGPGTPIPCDDGDPCNGVESCVNGGDCVSTISADCDANGREDACDIASGAALDCQPNGVPDLCDIRDETSADCNGDGVPDECAPVLAPSAEPNGVSKCRALSMVPVNPGRRTGLRVTLVALQHVNPPYTGGVPRDFSTWEGEVRWVGAPRPYVESDANPVPFYASVLQCQPYYRDWGTVGLIHVFGSEVVPSSTYHIQAVLEGCGVSDEGDYSDPLVVTTSRWGDVVAPFTPPSESTQPDTADFSALVNKFKSVLGAPIKARAALAGTVPDLAVDIGFTHVSACVDAFRGLPYPYIIPACP